MKKTALLLLGIIMAYGNSYASPPSSQVQKAFTQRYPAASQVKWEQTGKSNWEAEFLYEGYTVLAEFSKRGNWLNTKTNINIVDLPPALATSINTKYPGWSIRKVLKSETPMHGVSYKAEINNEKEAKVVVCNDGSCF